MKNLILDCSEEAILGFNLDGEIDYMNPASQKLFQNGPKENQTLFFQKDLLPQLEPDFEHIRNTILLGEGGSKKIVKLKNPKKQSISLSLNFSPIQDQAKKIVGISVFARRISSAEKAKSRAFDLLDTAPDAIVVVNETGQIVLVNNQTVKLFGYEKEELIGQDVEVLIPNAIKKDHVELREKYAKKPTTRRMGSGMELFAKRKDQSTFPSEISLSPLKTDKELYISAAIRDISDRKKAEKKLQKINAKLKHQNKELEQFAYIASHDLQEPLRTVISFSKLLEKQHSHELNDDGLKKLKFITDASNRMSDLIKGLLDYSRIGRNKTKETIDCKEVLEAVCQDLSLMIEDKDASILLHGEMPKIKAYRTEIRQLFQNLLANGIKFQDPDSKPQVEVTCEHENGTVLFSIKDNGIGIPDKFKEKVFKIFQRLHSQKAYPGTGIGLAHCQKIAELHDGSIWVEDNLPKGSTFYFRIPKKPD